MLVTTNQKQKTIKQSVTLKGVGIHTGASVSLNFKPAPPNTGYVFVRVDMEGHPSVKADIINVVATERGTVLKQGEADVRTTEHVLAALVGMDLDNVIIEIDSVEPPIMDGSSKDFVEALEKADIQEQDKYRQEFVVKEPIHYTTDDGNSMSLVAASEYQVTTIIDFRSEVLQTQTARLGNIGDFKTEIASSRTFSFLHELEMLLDKQLIKGGDLSNAVIYVDQEVSEETIEKIRQKLNIKTQKLQITKDKILNNVELNYPNEAARHKLLDVIGDLALIGYKIRGEVIAVKPGHKVNTEFAKEISKQIKLFKPVPNVNLNSTPVKDINEIMKMLPHKPPFLLVDKILELSENRVVGLKGVTMNEPFFKGHFPSEPVMPGVLIIEAMAQVGGVLVLEQVPDPENYITYFLKMDQVKFKQKVVPGDTIIFEGDLVSPIRRGICHMAFKSYVNNKVVAEAELIAQVVKNK